MAARGGADPLGARRAAAPPVAAAATELPLPSSAVPSMSQTMRWLKRRDTGLYNRLASIALDAQFVVSLRARFPGAPLLANLRCGGWYAPRPDGACHFKSTDGHARNAGFSLTRLNVAALRALATRGAALLIDSTRSGKRHPDAATRTAPLWAAVLNEVRRRRRWERELARRSARGVDPRADEDLEARGGSRGECAQRADLSRGEATHPPAEGAWAPAGPAWRAVPVLPPWAGPSEADALAPRVGEWASAFEQLGRRDLEELLADMPKPIGCLWIDPSCSLERFAEGDRGGSGGHGEEEGGEGGEAEGGERERGEGERGEAEGGRGEGGEGERGGGEADRGSESGLPPPDRPPSRRASFLDSLDFAPFVLVNASLPDGRGRRTVAVAADELGRLEAARAAATSGGASGPAGPRAAEGGGAEARAFAFDYVPGGGDDEESWSCGLTPEDAWTHMLELLSAGPDGAPAAARRVVERREEAERRVGGARGGVGRAREGAMSGGEAGGDEGESEVALPDAGGSRLSSPAAEPSPAAPGAAAPAPAPPARLPPRAPLPPVRVLPARAVDEHHPPPSASLAPGISLPPPEELFPGLWRVPGVPGPLAVGPVRAARELVARGGGGARCVVELLAERENAVRVPGTDESFSGFADALAAAARDLRARAPGDPPLVVRLPTLRGKRDKHPLREAILVAVTLLHVALEAKGGERGSEDRVGDAEGDGEDRVGGGDGEGENRVGGGDEGERVDGATAPGGARGERPRPNAQLHGQTTPQTITTASSCVVFACPRGDDASVAAAAAALLAAARGDSPAAPGRPELRRALGRLYAAVPNARPGGDALKAALAAFVRPFCGNGGGTGTGGVVPTGGWGRGGGFAL